MTDPAVLIAGAGAVTTAIAVSWFIWWATRRNAFWAMAAGVLVTLLMFGVALLIGWLIARATYGR
jgi:tetrahydromethanopterin S-methyltransferase subunit D